MSHPRRRSPKQTFSLVTVGLVLSIGLIAYLSTRQLHLPLYVVWLITLSAITFFWYGFDKEQSKRDGSRVPEIVLQLLTLAGGFPGGWLGRFIFHHKTRHNSFLIILILSTILHIGLAQFLLTL